MIELIRPTPFDGYYATWDGKIMSFWNGRWVERKPQTGRNGRHFRTTVMSNGKRLHLSIHRLVCKAWHGPAPFDGALCRHLDDD